jgi:hypothetical protein
MAEKQKTHRKAELRSRWRAMSQDGSIARLRSEGRLTALYVFLVADWTTCEARVPLRRAARFMGVYPNTIRRGLDQMIAEHMIEKMDKEGTSGKARYKVLGGSRVVTGGVTSGDPPRSRAVDSAHTSGGQRAHSVCAQGSRAVDSAHTGCGHDSVSFSGSSVRTSERISTADAGAGGEPARRRRPSRMVEGWPPPVAAAGGQEAPVFDPSGTITQEVDT